MTLTCPPRRVAIEELMLQKSWSLTHVTLTCPPPRVTVETAKAVDSLRDQLVALDFELLGFGFRGLWVMV